MSDDQAKLILAELAEIKAMLAQPKAAEPVLTRDEAKHYVKKPSNAAFSRWCKKWGVRPIEQGRYSRANLDKAIERSGARVLRKVEK